MPFCLENYIPLFKGLVDYFRFIKNKLERTRVLNSPKKEPEIIPEVVKVKEPSVLKSRLPETTMRSSRLDKMKNLKDLRSHSMRYSNRYSNKANYSDNMRLTRNHYILKNDHMMDLNMNSASSIVKKLTAEQKEKLKSLETTVRKIEEKNLKLVDGSVIEQTKIILTIIRNLVSSNFNEKVVFNEKPMLNILYDLLLYNNDSEIDKLALENFAVLSR